MTSKISTLNESKQMNKPIFIITVLSLIITPMLSLAGDYFIVTGVYKGQKEAQYSATDKGGWVLYTNVYDKFTPKDMFSVVRGPYKAKKDAEKELKQLLKSESYFGSYIKDAGKLQIKETHEMKSNLGNNIPVALLQAIMFGEIGFDIKEEKGAANPCEPQEPYIIISPKKHKIEGSVDENTGKVTYKPIEETLNIGPFFYIKRTGEIDVLRGCSE